MQYNGYYTLKFSIKIPGPKDCFEQSLLSGLLSGWEGSYLWGSLLLEGIRILRLKMGCFDRYKNSLKGYVRDEDFAFLGQVCAEIITVCLLPINKMLL